ncbi:tyrosine-type recombinase/integrase [Sinorhizobium medicae]|uniref:Tyrosine-type recombinase/integrase n=1 Tax=Sinorhizobium medicae TaxID=110321 RepID=A0A6G1WJH6_9HYPH|nr:tyrosine-type recombinase/integrase [Sinorhizobium medicae]MQW69775.1 tyrosine-type recombinase/integrase [Sinorhizobium medicae]MQX46532.1 tyrosine-type recombinase/integrase [Sinorhizobium medicae]MQX85223.1 tyrosine-type recombinase/integrase [Sinorhizobium medicae]
MSNKHPDYPYVSSFQDRHGKTRWRFRKGKIDKNVPGEPHTPEFDAAYEAIVNRRTPASVTVLKEVCLPRSLKHAYQLLRKTEKWQALSPKSQGIYSREIEKMLDKTLNGGEIGNGPLDQLKRSHVKQILQLYSETPHLQRTILIAINKLIMVGINEEWITADPTYKLSADYDPETDGHPPWTIEQMEQFERYHRIGSTARVAYALGLWLGNRVSDVVKLRWSQLVTKRIAVGDEERVVEGFEFVQFKGRHRKRRGNAKGADKSIFVPMTPWLEGELAPLARDTEFVLAWKEGRKDKRRGYVASYISAQMGRWAEEAGLPAGRKDGYDALGMHGLRKSIAIRMAEADVTTRQMMAAMGWNNKDMPELYSRKADQARLAIQAMDKMVASEKRRRRAAAQLTVVK